MKRLYIGIGFLAVLLAVGIGITVAFARLHEPLSEDLRAAIETAEAGDWETTDELVTKIRGDWERCRNFTAAVADHEPLEQMESLLAQIEVYARHRNVEEFASSAAALARMAAAMANSQSISWWNLL